MPLNSERRKKLSELLPEGIIADSAWLEKNGFPRYAIDNMVKSGNLAALSHGIYVRGTVLLQWEAIVYSLQYLLKMELTVGGLTALEMQGLGHYLSFYPKKQVHLYGKDKMPSWLNTLVPQVTFFWHSENNLLGRKHKTKSLGIDPMNYAITERQWREGFPDLIVSRPEKALLEILTDVPEKITFEHADQLVQGMTSLSPSVLQKLLEQINNVKVKRLFFWLADRHKYVWLQKLNKERIDFGTGNRMLVKGGKLNKQYHISVPELS